MVLVFILVACLFVVFGIDVNQKRRKFLDENK